MSESISKDVPNSYSGKSKFKYVVFNDMRFFPIVNMDAREILGVAKGDR